MTKSYFITATGTDIGKTHILCRLIESLEDVTALKPIISGFEENAADSDTARILTSLKLPVTKENIEAISPWRFKAALSPDMAAAKEGRQIDFPQLVEFCNRAKGKSEYLFIEGVGGVMVPLDDKYTICDLIKAVDIPVILVAGSYLGSISHTLTAVDALKTRGIRIHMVVVNDFNGNIDIDDTVRTLRNFVNVPVLKIREKIEEKL